MADDVQRIPQHRHCRRCGKAFTGEGIEGQFCSKECHEYAGAEAKSKLRKYMIVVVLLWAVVAVAVVVVGF